MSNYILFTDSCCDLTQNYVDELGIQVMPLSVTVADKTYKNYPNESDLKVVDFYKMMREGKTGMTSALNGEQIREYFVPFLEAGKDILYLAFSSALSCTYQNAYIAAQELSEQYPDRRIYVVDTLCASSGQGLLVYLTAQVMKSGVDIDQLRDYVENTKLHLCHWFTVDDLMHLKRGGRLSAGAAVIGTVLGIKPVMHVDNNGKLVPVSKTRGRASSLEKLVDRIVETAIDPKEQVMFICHGDCEKEAKEVAKMMHERTGVKDVRLFYTGPVIGAHSGVGTMALFFLGKER